jgi:cytochrome P450
LSSPSTIGKVVRLSPHEVDFSSITGAKRIHSFNKPFLKTQMYAMFDTASGSANIFSARDPDFHARHRRLLSSAMSESSLKSAEALVHRRASLAIEKISLDMKEHGAANVLKWFMFFSTDVIGELTFGESFKMLELGKVNRTLPSLRLKFTEIH